MICTSPATPLLLRLICPTSFQLAAAWRFPWLQLNCWVWQPHQICPPKVCLIPFFNLFLVSILSCNNYSKFCLETVNKGTSSLLLLIGHLAPSLKVLYSPHYEKAVKNQGIFIIFFSIHSYSSFLAWSNSSTYLYFIPQCKIILITC